MQGLQLIRVSNRGSRRHCDLTAIYMLYWSGQCNGDEVELEDVSSSWISYITESLQSHPNPASVLCLKSYATQTVSSQGQYVACDRATDGPTGAVPAIPGVGVTKPIFSFRYFPHFPLLSKQALAIEYRVYIWQVSPQLSCSDACQIWMWFRESNRYFCKIENFAYGEISERSFSNPHPRADRMNGQFLVYHENKDAINPASIMAMSRHAETSLSGNPILMMGASMETVSE